MLGLITDRNQNNLNRLDSLRKKGWQNMTASERAEWTGDLFTASDFGYSEPFNLIPYEYTSERVELIRRNDHLIAKAITAGTYRYGVIVLGSAELFTGKTLTLSLNSVTTTGSATPRLSLYWHNSEGYEYAGASLIDGGSITFTPSENTGNREYLALYVYAGTNTEVSVGDVVRYNEPMLEFGDVKHQYVPYTPILPTPATKGAYNYSDLNRVERATWELGESLGLDLVTKTDWGVWDVPTSSDMARYLNNIVKIRNACPDKASFPVLPSRMDGLDITGANAIEKTLVTANISTGSMYRAGDLFCGEV